MSPHDGGHSEHSKKYSAPALEKGLDVLELLATKSKTLSKTRIAQELGRSTSEVFRMLGCLEERGYISERIPGDGYGLTMRLHDLVNKWPPHERLVAAAVPEMRILAEETLQSCHLGVHNSGNLYVAAQAESPLPISLNFKIGSEFPLLRTASGRVLLAFQNKKVADFWIQSCDPGLSAQDQAALQDRLNRIRNDGFEQCESDRVEGLVDLSCPILDAQGAAVAAITVPFLKFLNRDVDAKRVIERLVSSAGMISTLLGGGERT
jgi:DNA-binding IclR family transcriptional regulator